jgi:hypothetical protein
MRHSLLVTRYSALVPRLSSHGNQIRSPGVERIVRIASTPMLGALPSLAAGAAAFDNATIGATIYSILIGCGDRSSRQPRSSSAGGVWLLYLGCESPLWRDGWGETRARSARRSTVHGVETGRIACATGPRGATLAAVRPSGILTIRARHMIVPGYRFAGSRFPQPNLQRDSLELAT